MDNNNTTTETTNAPAESMFSLWGATKIVAGVAAVGAAAYYAYDYFKGE